ncbi:hypothetical protein B0J11DRAFT_46874 [Dendryphion nanum]|uniref:SET domain-containing protein n=1 Tax=Dendryphion nanum TaxID=256645 RepID=A0A9P9IXQ0_9PLEO|nr:hypothetical protein B0J11DRAFT_46874 [Dendryphion nanum]
MSSVTNGNTFFLTEQEVERIRNTVKQRVKKCEQVQGHAREPRVAKDAISQATGASLMADMGGAADPDVTETKGGRLPVLPVGQPYPPCVVALDHLEPIKLSDIKLETHHRGKKLVVKRVAPVVTLTARSWTMVQDEAEETERLEVCLHKLQYGEEFLESTKSFIVKEPYFTLTDQGEPTIRIDHPSDLVVYREAVVAEGADAIEKLARKFKDRGNAALKKQDLPEAHAEYSQALEIAEQDDDESETIVALVRDIHRNRALVNISLGQFDEAKTDAHEALIHENDQRSKDLDSKSCYRAGTAAYNLGKYDLAKKIFTEQQKFAPEDKDAATYLKMIDIRIREQESGSYNWKKIRTNLSKARPRVDAANFLTNTEVKESKGRGRGLFATRPIASGEIVICEKAFCVVWGHEQDALTGMTHDLRDDRIRISPVGLTRSLAQKLLKNPSLSEKVLDLYGDYAGSSPNIDDTTTTETHTIDVFRLHDIVSRNAFGPGDQFGASQSASTGLWVWAAYINHSCLPNAKKEYLGDLMLLRATRPISFGEEIFHSYDDSLDYDARQGSLLNTWGFECNCGLCVVEAKDEPEIRRKRRELVREAEAFVDREEWAGAKRLTIVKAQRLARGIEETFDKERYGEGDGGVPKRAGERIREWIGKATPRR